MCPKKQYMALGLVALKLTFPALDLSSYKETLEEFLKNADSLTLPQTYWELDDFPVKPVWEPLLFCLVFPEQ